MTAGSQLTLRPLFSQKAQSVFNGSEPGQSLELLDGRSFICKAFLSVKPVVPRPGPGPLWDRHPAFPVPKAKVPGFSTELHGQVQDHESKEDGKRLGGTAQSPQALLIPTTGMPRNRGRQASVIQLRCLKSKNKSPRP